MDATTSGSLCTSQASQPRRHDAEQGSHGRLRNYVDTRIFVLNRRERWSSSPARPRCTRNSSSATCSAPSPRTSSRAPPPTRARGRWTWPAGPASSPAWWPRASPPGQRRRPRRQPGDAGRRPGTGRGGGVEVTWDEGNATSLPYGDGAFDLALCQQGLQFFPDQPAALRELHRVLAPGGRALISTWAPLDRSPAFAAYNRVAQAHLGLAPCGPSFSLTEAERVRGLLEGPASLRWRSPR